jgi:hypothetical protein
LKLVKKVRQPSSAFPSHYSKIDSAMKNAFVNIPDGSFNRVGNYDGSGYLDFRVEKSTPYARSKPIIFEQLGVAIGIKGYGDALLTTPDGERVLVDNKTASHDLPKLAKYRKQLSSYKYALENPLDPVKYPATTIDRMGLIVFDESEFAIENVDSARFSGALKWIEMDTDDEEFHGLIARVAELVALPKPPKAAEKCDFCKYGALMTRLAAESEAERLSEQTAA